VFLVVNTDVLSHVFCFDEHLIKTICLYSGFKHFVQDVMLDLCRIIYRIHTGFV
jgi:hypothetical protein